MPDYKGFDNIIKEKVSYPKDNGKSLRILNWEIIFPNVCFSKMTRSIREVGEWHQD